MQVNWQPGKTGGQLVQTVEQAKLIHRSHGPRFENEDDIFTYMVDNVTFVAVFDGECAMAYFKAELAGAFEDEVIIVELR